MRTNLPKTNKTFTYEGAPGIPPVSPLAELRRAVSSCMLWEDKFYESGVDIAERISGLVGKCNPADVASLAVEARTQMKLRHAPLWLLAGLVKHGNGPKADVYADVINRADEMGELVAMLWKDGKKPLPKQMKLGLGKAFGKFDAYQLGKYNRKVDVSLTDVLRLTHPTPADEAQSQLWKSVIDGTIAAPDTWEVALSGGADKKETFTRLLQEGRLGYLALLRNLRNMEEARVDRALVKEAILARKGAHMVLPFRFVSAANAAPGFAKELDEALLAQLGTTPVLSGVTAVCVDVSGSMTTRLSAKSELSYIDAAASLASLINGEVRVFPFATTVREVPARRGLAGIDAIKHVNNVGHGTNIGEAVTKALSTVPDRVIVVSDMQSHDVVNLPKGTKGYMVNVAGYKNGIGYGDWTRIDGWSESTIKWITQCEA